ncbi:MAG: hypothetical protein V4556_12500 [Bacteroidota bacterium]
MSSKYKVGEDEIPHFVTFSVVGWVDVFAREHYKEIFIGRLKFCIDSRLAFTCLGYYDESCSLDCK